MSAESRQSINPPAVPEYYDSGSAALATYLYRYHVVPSKWMAPCMNDRLRMGYDRVMVSELVQKLHPAARIIYENYAEPEPGKPAAELPSSIVWDCGGELFLQFEGLTEQNKKPRPEVLRALADHKYAASNDDEWSGWKYGRAYYNPTYSRERVRTLISALRICVKSMPDSDPTVHVLQYDDGFSVRERTIKQVDSMDLGLHYGQAFPVFHANLIAYLAKQTKGIALFHGPPGTGKTHYIRYLLSDLRNSSRATLIVPSGFASNLSDPAFLTFFLDWSGEFEQGVVLIVEDAEEALESRGGRSTAVSNLLNLTDGLMNDITKVSVIATVNVDIDKIDTAMIRNGRMSGIWHFGPLTAAEATALGERIAADKGCADEPPVFTTDTTVADVYATVEEMQVIRKEKEDPQGRQVGFK